MQYRICVRRPPLRITKAPRRHPGPSSTSCPAGVRRLSFNVGYNCQTYLPFSDEVARSLCSTGSVCVDHYYVLLKAPASIQDLRPPADQLESGVCLQTWDITARLIFPSVTRWPVLYAVVVRICMRRPLLRITKALDDIQVLCPSAIPHSKQDPGPRSF